MAKVRKHTAFRGGKITTIPEHTRTDKFRNLPRSSCINRIRTTEEGRNVIMIRGVEYPYDGLPKNRVSGLVNAGSAGKYYNKHIRGKYA